MSLKKIRVVLLASQGFSTRCVFNALNDSFQVTHVIIEKSESRSIFLKRRLRRLGKRKVMGQILFQGIINPFLKFQSKKRLFEIQKQKGLIDKDIPKERITSVISANEKNVIKILRAAKPDIVVINGTRILKRHILEAVPATFLNIHAGITPMYRGVHGAYWALVSQDAKNIGVTIHIVDTGIDTGGILVQEKIKPQKEDNFVTYPLLQLGAALPKLIEIIPDVINENIKMMNIASKKSKLWYHPTFFEYLWKRFMFGIH